jgi:hypothetical protein
MQTEPMLPFVLVYLLGTLVDFGHLVENRDEEVQKRA